MHPAPEDPAPSATSGAVGVPECDGHQGELLAFMQRVAQGDEAAFPALYDALAARVHGLAVRVLRDAAHAEEVTQEVFLDVWRLARHYDPERGSVLSWAMTMTHRRAVDRVRSVGADARRTTAYGVRDHAAPRDLTSEAVERKLDEQAVVGALEELPDAQRAAITLAYYEGRPHAEVAEILQVPLGTAKSRIRDGLIRLRSVMGVSA